MSRHNDMQRAADAVTKIEASSTEYDGDKKVAARTLVRRSFSIPVAAVLANGSGAIVPNASPVQFRAPANIRILGAQIIPTGTSAEHASNNAQISLKTLAANGATDVTIATANTAPVVNGGTGSLAAGVPTTIALVSNVANTRVTKGTVIGPAVAQNASGVLTTASTIQFDYELEGPYSDYSV
ncbi:MAG TPA: hypothetical protein VFN70_18195 [Burkholderiales bacterium]|nr:hypothetical protein [Burkholderiales bacterium]